jgi:hypothetical protein
MHVVAPRTPPTAVFVFLCMRLVVAVQHHTTRLRGARGARGFARHLCRGIVGGIGGEITGPPPLS